MINFGSAIQSFISILLKAHIALYQIALASYGYHLVISEVKVLAYCFADRRIDLFIMLLQSHIIK